MLLIFRCHSQRELCRSYN